MDVNVIRLVDFNHGAYPQIKSVNGSDVSCVLVESLWRVRVIASCPRRHSQLSTLRCLNFRYWFWRESATIYWKGSAASTEPHKVRVSPARLGAGASAAAVAASTEPHKSKSIQKTKHKHKKQFSNLRQKEDDEHGRASRSVGCQIRRASRSVGWPALRLTIKYCWTGSSDIWILHVLAQGWKSTCSTCNLTQTTLRNIMLVQKLIVYINDTLIRIVLFPSVNEHRRPWMATATNTFGSIIKMKVFNASKNIGV